MEVLPDALARLIEAIENLAPQMWAALRRQVVIEGVMNVVYIAFVLVAMWVGNKARRHTDRKRANAQEKNWDTSEFEYWDGSLFGWGILGLGFLFLVSSVSNLIRFILNPDFYAIMFILKMLEK